MPLNERYAYKLKFIYLNLKDSIKSVHSRQWELSFIKTNIHKIKYRYIDMFIYVELELQVFENDKHLFALA